MPPLLEIGLSNALAATVLALAAAVAGCYRRRPALAHSLWLLVLLKLVTPPLVSLPVAWPAALAMRGKQVPVPTAQPQRVAEMPPSGSGPSEASPSDVAVVPPLSLLAEPTLEPRPGPVTGLVPPTMTSSWRVRPWEGIAGLWLAGTVLYAVVTTARLVRFGTLARQARRAPEELCAQVKQLAGQLGLASAPLVGLVAGRIAPLLWAAGGAPRLLLPEELWARLDCDQRDALLLHELAHLRRRDHWVRLLELVVTSLYWWHPIVWWARGRLRQAEEECCDAWVVHARPRSARSYAIALVETLDFLSESRGPVPVAASGLGHFSSLKRRLAMILDATTPPALSRLARLAIVGLAVLLLPLAPAWGQPPDNVRDGRNTPTTAARAATPRSTDADPDVAPAPSVPVPPPRSSDGLDDDNAPPPAASARAPRSDDAAAADDDAIHVVRARRTELVVHRARVEEAKLAVDRAARDLIAAQRRLAELEDEMGVIRGSALNLARPAGMAGTTPAIPSANRRAGGRATAPIPNEPASVRLPDGLNVVGAHPGAADTNQRLDALEQKFGVILRELERLKRADRRDIGPDPFAPRPDVPTEPKPDTPRPSLPRQ